MKLYKPTPKALQQKAIVQRVQAQTTNHIYLKLGILFFCILFMLAFTTVKAQTTTSKSFNNLSKEGIIIDGYNSVAFFTNNKPVKGDAPFSPSYDAQKA